MSERVSPERLSDTVRELEGRLGKLERESAKLRSASVGEGGIRLRDGGSLRVEGGQIVVRDVDGNETFVASTDGLVLQGRLEVSGEIQSGNWDPDPEEGPPTGYQLGDDGVVRANDLDLADGSIALDALASAFGAEGYGDSFFSSSASNSDSLDIPVAVPDWASQATVVAIGSVTGTAGGGVVGEFQAQVTISGDTGPSLIAFVDDVEFPPVATVTTHHQWSQSGLGSNNLFMVTLGWGAQGTVELQWRAALSVLVFFSR